MRKLASKENAKKSESIKRVDEYIAAAPKESRAKLAQLRTIVKTTAPRADEGISYGIPYYKYYGALAGFAAFKNHIGFFGRLTEAQKHEFKAYDTAKGTVRFPIDQPLPVALIKKLLKSRIKQNETARKK